MFVSLRSLMVSLFLVGFGNREHLRSENAHGGCEETAVDTRAATMTISDRELHTFADTLLLYPLQHWYVRRSSQTPGTQSDSTGSSSARAEISSFASRGIGVASMLAARCVKPSK
ncbi:hypothetical protein FKP32DRAFT_1077560 [Trametes sanguinea]|nr:hypothetical protein FKP32DRAFT_1077560 [Trametes sanguinea]